MIKLKISNQPVTVKVSKNESGTYEADLFIKDFCINKHRTNDYSIDLSEYDGATLDCILNGSELSCDGKNIATFENVFDKGTMITIGLLKNRSAAALYHRFDKGAVIFAKVSLEELPKNLFARRNQFPVIVSDDENWTIVRYANLHQHTEYSLLDGMVRTKDLAKKTEYAAAITDHGNMHGFNEFYKEMKKAGKKPIIGCEIYIETPGGEPRKVLVKSEDNDDIMFGNEKEPKSTLAGEHMILLAENNTGLNNLFYLVTHASEHFYRKPHVTWEMLEEHSEGLIATSACIAGTIGRSIKEIIKCEQAGNQEILEQNRKILDLFITKMIRIFGKDRFFIELQNHHFPLEDEIMKRIRVIAKEYGLKTTIGIDAHYLNKEDAYIHELWLCQQTKKTIKDPDRMRFSGDGYYVHSSEEVLELFPDDVEAMDNTLDIADRCNVVIKSDGYHMPKFPLPDGFEDEFSYLQYLAKEGFKSKFGGMTREDKIKYAERLKYELDVIKTLGWPGYFLVVADYIAYAKDKNVKEHIDRYFPKKYYDQTKIPESVLKDFEIYVGGGRGSAAGSLVAYCTGITDVDPIKYDLLFERFLNPDRISAPDIDTDFEDSKRGMVVEYCRAKYGADHVSGIITFGTSAAKNAVRSITRVLGKPVNTGSRIADMIPKTPKITIRNALLENQDLKMAYENEPETKQIIDYAMQIEGLKTNKSLHACGKLVTDAAITNYMPEILMEDPKTKENVWTTQIQGPECEEMGCLKMDFLGLRQLGLAHDCINTIKKDFGIELDYNTIPIDDPDTYTFLLGKDTTGVFQAESELFTKTLAGALADLPGKLKAAEYLPADQKESRLKQIGEEMFLRVADVNALVRPGPNQFVNTYNARVLDPSKTAYDDPSMEPQLKSTFGIMLYQEQVMLLCRDMAGFSGGQMDEVRKAMG